MAEQEEATPEVEKWLGRISAYEKEFKKWEGRADKVLKRYRDDSRSGNRGYQEAKFNILWSNVQTLSAATFARLPKPDVSRRFKDNDPVGRVASLLLERALEYEIQKYTDYSSTLRADIYDRFLGGRGTAWVRYEPHFRAQQQSLPTDGTQITEDIDEPQEELDYECAPCDYVHWRDFGHTVARTWDEVTAVWRKVYLTRSQCIERFGEDIGSKLPLDSIPEDTKNERQYGNTTSERSRACVYEIWDKANKEAIWLSKSLKEVADKRPDPLGLEEFFPCPRPLFATLTNDSLVPIPDYSFYQDQANELDIICDRIDGLVKALKVSGVYDDSTPALQRLFTEADNGTLIPVKNWAAFAEKNGLKGSLDLVDLTPIANALKQAYEAMEQVKGQIYEITGISDIIRGETEASETATAQQLKGQYASLRLKTTQEQVAQFATELLQIKAQVICGKFSPQTILAISAADQLSQSDKQLIGQALELLIGPERMQNPEAPQGPNPLRSFRVEVAADTLVYLDEQQEKQDRLEFLNATSQFLEKAVPAAQTAPTIVPLLMEMLKFGVTGFKVGKSIEGMFDETAERLKQEAANPQPKPDPEMAKVQAQQQSDQAKLQAQQQSEQAKLQQEQQSKILDFQLEKQRLAMEEQARQREQQFQAIIEQHRNQLEFEREQARIMFDKWQAMLDAKTKVAVAEISAQSTLDAAQLNAAKQESSE